MARKRTATPNGQSAPTSADGKAARVPQPPQPNGTKRRASIYPEEPLPQEFCNLIDRLRDKLDMPIWLLVQNSSAPDEAFADISPAVYKGFQNDMTRRCPAGSAAIVVDSPGGIPTLAFRIARLFQRRVNQFVVLIPQYAKSAATLLALGGHIIMGRDAELGPLDMQVFDAQEEKYDSALNAVQALERLSASALAAVDQTMQLLMRRLPKRSDILLPHALEYVANLLKPLFEKVDTVDYSRKSRDLKLAEECAARLMRKTHGFARGREIARKLVQNCIGSA